MKKNAFKLISCMLCFGIIFSFNFVFADTASEETVIKNIASSILDILMWFAYAIAIGALIFFGIKYMLSGANEKADLKGMLPKYLIGIVAILFCFSIASWVAGIAGNDPAEEIIGVGEEAGNHFTGITDDSDSSDILDPNGSFAVGGTPGNPYIEQERIDNGDGTYTLVVSGNNRNDGKIESTYNSYDERLIEKKEYDSEGELKVKTTYDENGVYNKKLYDQERIDAEDFIYGEVLSALSTQDNGYKLTATLKDTNGDGVNDKVIYTDVLGAEKGEGDIFYDEQGRISRIFRNERGNGEDKGYTEHIYMDIKYTENGFTVENIDALAWVNPQQYKYEVITNNSGNIKSVTYYDYVTKFGVANDEYVKRGVTDYNALAGPRN